MSGTNSGFVKPVRVARAYEELAAAIRNSIVAGELLEGERIPSEASLARDARVSRSTVREALRTLEEAGFIARASPKVLVVRQQREEKAYEEVHRALERRNVTFRDVYETLFILEPEMVRLGTTRASERDVAALLENVAAQEANVEDLETWHQLSLEFHLALAELARNPALFIARTSLSELLSPAVRRVYSTVEDAREICALNARVAAEIAARDPEAAAHAARKAILHFRQSWEDAELPFDTQVSQLPARPPRR